MENRDYWEDFINQKYALFDINTLLMLQKSWAISCDSLKIFIYYGRAKIILQLFRLKNIYETKASYEYIIPIFDNNIEI